MATKQRVATLALVAWSLVTSIPVRAQNTDAATDIASDRTNTENNIRNRNQTGNTQDRGPTNGDIQSNSDSKQNKCNESADKKIPILVRLAILVAFTMTGNLTSAIASNDDSQTDITSSYNDTTAQAATARWLSVLGQFRGKPIGAARPFATANTPSGLDSGRAYLYFVADAPESWNTNPATVASGAIRSWRFDPKFQVNTAFQADTLLFSFQSTGDVDRYSSNSAANSESLQSIFKLSLKCAANIAADAAGEALSGGEKGSMCAGDWGRHLSPYLMYQSSLRFADNFGPLKSNQNDLGAGFSANITNFGETLLQEKKFNSSFPNNKFSIDVQATRRYSNTGADSYSLNFKPSYIRNFCKEFALSLQPSYRIRWFDTQAGVSRVDNSVIVPATIIWDPTPPKGSILEALQPEIRFALNFSRTWSNVAAKNFHQWDIGPTIELVAVPFPGN